MTSAFILTLMKDLSWENKFPWFIIPRNFGI